MDNKQIWQTVLGELEVSLSRANFTTWFKNTFIYSQNNDLVIIAVPSSFAQEWLSKKYSQKILEALKKHFSRLTKIEYKIISKTKQLKDSFPPIAKTRPQEENQIKISKNHGKLEPKYIFDSFVVGTSNRLAHATAVAISKNPGKKYNPFFIYGGVGLGKTHLMHAIGNEISRNNPRKKIIYVPCEEFTNEFISSIQNKKIDKFKDKYRNIDVLLIDDIQFLSKKDGTQEEFFHTFNALHGANRQLIFSADRKPQDIPEITSRLTSRLAWGMVADIQPPDEETRKAILKRKAQEKNLGLDDDMVAYIAKNIKSNIRELEGALNKIQTNLEIYHSELSLGLVTKILAENISNSRLNNLTTAKIMDAVTDFFSVDKKEILSKKRNKELVYPRQIIMYLLRNEVNFSFPKIGRELGGKDHTTIMHGVSKIEKQVKRDGQLQGEIALIKEKLYI